MGVLALLIGSGLYLFNATRLTGDQVPMPFGTGMSVVLSGSMEPTLSVGDLLIVREADAYTTDDVVVYQSGRMAVVHRIVEIQNEEIITKGDANNAADTPITADMIKGKVIAAIPLLGYLVWFLKTPAGIITTIAAAVILTELSFRNGKREKEQETEQLKAEIRQLMEELQKND